MPLPNFKIPQTLFKFKMIKDDFLDTKYTKFTDAPGSTHIECDIDRNVIAE